MLVHPASADSIPTSANQEDHVSMGATSARHARDVLRNVEMVLGLELLCAAQGLDFRVADGRARGRRRRGARPCQSRGAPGGRPRPGADIDAVTTRPATLLDLLRQYNSPPRTVLSASRCPRPLRRDSPSRIAGRAPASSSRSSPTSRWPSSWSRRSRRRPLSGTPGGGEGEARKHRGPRRRDRREARRHDGRRDRPTPPQTRLGFTEGDQRQLAIAADRSGHVYVLYPQEGGVPGCVPCADPTI